MKHLYLLTIILLSTLQYSTAQVVNDNPCDALSIDCASTVIGSSINASNSLLEAPSCAYGSLDDVFYSFEAIPGQTYTAEVNGINYDGVLVIYTGPCDGNLFQIACSDVGLTDNVAETIDFYVNFNTTVVIRTYDYDFSGGDFELSLSCSVANDEVCSATSIECGQTVSGTTVGSSESVDLDASCASLSGADVFYYFEAFPGISYYAEVSGANYEGTLIAYSGDCGLVLDELACSNDVSGNGETESISFTVDSPTNVVLRTYDIEGHGDFELSLDCILPNDNPCDALPISCGQTVYGTNESALLSALPSPSCAEGSLEDVFYSFEAQPNFEYQILINGEDYGAVLVAYLGSCTGDLTEIGCVDEGLFSGIEEELNVTVETAQTVLIRTYDYPYSQGSFEISLNCLEFFDCPEENLNVGDACNDGDPYTITDQITDECTCQGEPSSASLSGTIDWNSTCGERGITFYFYNNLTGNLDDSYATSLAESGDYILPNVLVGQYDIYYKVEGYLQSSVLDFSVIDGPNWLTLESANQGDLNNDNGVNIVDVSVVNEAFGSTTNSESYNHLADLNCDGGVNIIDVSILNASFGMVGAQP